MRTQQCSKGTTHGGIPHAQAPLPSGSLSRTVVATGCQGWPAILSPPLRGPCLMARQFTETWSCVAGAIQPDVREGGHHGPPKAARPRDGQPARDGLEHVYYVRRYYGGFLRGAVLAAFAPARTQSSLFLFYKIQLSTGCRWYRCDSCLPRRYLLRQSASGFVLRNLTYRATYTYRVHVTPACPLVICRS